MLSSLAASAALPLLNHLLHTAPWARERLQAWAGNIVCIELFPFALKLSVTAVGVFTVADASARATASIQLSPFQAARLTLKDPAAFRSVALDGDVQFAAALGSVLRELAWDAEADLARVVGDMAAHRIVRGARSVQNWQHDAADSACQTLLEYATEERPLLAKRRLVAAFITEVDTIRDDVARLEKRLQLLAARRS